MENTATATATLLSTQVAEEVRAMMARRRISGRKLAEMLDVSPSWVSYRMTGVTPIGLDDLQRIASALGVQPSDLMPRATEGRVLTTVGQRTDEQGRGITIRKFGLTERPQPTGHPKRTLPDPSTRRPGRVFAAHART